MTTTRFLFILFALLNILFFAAARGWLDLGSSEESGRISIELNPDRIKVLGPTPPPEITQTDTQTSPPPEQDASDASDASVCLAWSGLSAAQNNKLISLFSDAGIQTAVRDAQVAASWRVRVPHSLPTREAAEILVDNMIIESGVEQSGIHIEETADNKFAIMLGKTFRNRRDAERHLETMKARRVNASIETYTATERRVEATVSTKKAEDLLDRQAFAKRYKPCSS